MFSYFCKRCDVTGRAELELPDATCWCCDRGDELVPEAFSLAVRRSQSHVVTYFPAAAPAGATRG